MFIAALAIQLIALVLGFYAIILLLQIDITKLQQYMLMFTIAALAQNICFLFEMCAGSAEVAMTAVKLEYVGSCFAIFFFMRFTCLYCKFKLPKFIQFLVFLLDFLIIGIVWTNDLHHLYYTNTDIMQAWITEGVYPHLKLDKGVFFYVFVLGCAAIPCITSLAAIISRIIKSKKGRSRNHFIIFLVLTCIPSLTLMLYTLGLFGGVDPSPTTLLFMLAIVVIFVWSRRNFDISHVASQTVLAEIDDAVILLDDDLRVVNCNAPAMRHFEELTEDCYGVRMDELKDFSAELFDETTKHDLQRGDRYYEVHTKKLMDDNKDVRGYVMIFFDVTDTRRYIEEISIMQHKAEEASVAKSEFLANMSHEIRTPMNAIVGLSDLIKEECRGRKVFQFACDITAASRNLLDIINDILDLSKVEAGKMELTERKYYLNDMIKETTGMISLSAKQRGLDFLCDVNLSLPSELCGDDGKIRQVLINLLNNAVKFTKKGFVKLSVTGECVANYVNLVFSVEDSGIGIEKKNLERIFDSFAQVDAKKNRNVEGTGLGLTISKKLIELLGGTIEVSSTYGIGTTFVVKLSQRIVNRTTIALSDADRQRNSDKGDELFTVENYNVLVVDDNKINRKVALGMLRGYGFNLVGAESGPDAINLCKKTCFDIIFMDHMMPDMDGVETVKHIRTECGENGKKPIIFALTANAMEGVKKMFLQSGFQDFIPKPVDRKTMNRVLSKWIPDDVKVYTDKIEDNPVSLDDISGIFVNGISIVKAMENHNGTLDDYLELLDLYYNDGMKKVSFLRELVECENWDRYRIETHGLKSASANIGAMTISDMAKQHEYAASDKDYSFIKRHFEEFINTFKAQLEDINEVLIKKKHGGGDDAQKPEIGAGELDAMIGEALELIENFKSKECAKKIQDILQYRLDNNVRDKLEEIASNIKMYNDDDAEDMLRELCNSRKK